MKTKKIVSLLLAIIMIVSLLPMSVLAEELSIGSVTGGSYTDGTALPEKSYEYTVKGNDGSIQKISVLGKDADTGNHLIPTAKAGTVYYTLVTDAANAKDNTYLIVRNVGNDHHAIKKNPNSNTSSMEKVVIEQNPELGEIVRGPENGYPDSEWYISQSGKYKNFNHKEGNTNNYFALVQHVHETGGWIKYWTYTYTFNTVNWVDNFDYDINGNTIRLKHWYNTPPQSAVKGETTNYVGANTKELSYSTSWGTYFTLYQKYEVKNNEYIMDAGELKKLIELAENKSAYRDHYVDFSGVDAALPAAKEAVKHDGKKFLDDASANAAMEQVDNAHATLQNALNALQLKTGITSVTPKIEWQRTYEVGGRAGQGDLLIPLPIFSKKGNSWDYSKLTWDWNKVKGLTTRPDMPVWDYNTNGQISDAPKKGGYSAATWIDRDKKVEVTQDNNNYEQASVRLITGTFVWPEGFDFNDIAYFESANDAKYSDIYAEINKDPNLQKRFANSKVLAINDTVYVAISKVDDTRNNWTKDDLTDHMVFWSGTDGKGLWSENGKTNADWGRNRPATFNGQAAAPAYHNAWPNMEDLPGGSNSRVKNHDLSGILPFSDGWYTIVDTSNVMTTLSSVYGDNEDLAGQKMRIDIFAFDDASQGGMDELKLQIKKPDENNARVTVNYWIDRVNGTFVGKTVLNTTPGTEIKLNAGTRVNELNHFKDKANLMAGDLNLADGVQVETIVAQKGNNNVVNVVYKGNMKDVKYFTYDFGVTNEFTYTHNTDINSLQVNCKTDKIDYKQSGRNVTFTYKPKNAEGVPVHVQLVINGEKTPVLFIPASNVLYEEDYFKILNDTKKAQWKLEGKNKVAKVTDNESTAFGYSDAYNASLGANGVYTTTLDASGAKKYSEKLTFTFRGQGLDLIGSCGPNTASLMISVRNELGEDAKNYFVNTAFTDGALGTLNQVPIIHLTGIEGSKYTVEVKAVNMNFKQPAAKTFSALKNSAVSVEDEIYLALAEMGLTDEEIENTEFINVEDSIGASTYALRNSVKAAPAAAPAQKIASIDGVRVYRDATGAAAAYPEGEAGITYTNVMKDGIAGNFAAYIEPSSQANGKTDFTVAEYKALGGPSNEIYLAPNTAIALKLAGNVASTQVSLRAVTGTTSVKLNNGTPTTIGHNTEMYYKVNADKGIIVIANNDSKNMLAVCNVKANITSIDSAAQAQAVAKMAMMMNAPVEPEVPEVGTFKPARFDVKLDVIKTLFNQYATLKVKTSDDVAYITVNGVRVDSNNVNLLKWGIHDYMRFAFRKTFKKDAAISFEVVAYDKNGNASDPIVKNK